jgi:hypothetical protein
VLWGQSVTCADTRSIVCPPRSPNGATCPSPKPRRASRRRLAASAGCARRPPLRAGELGATSGGGAGATGWVGASGGKGRSRAAVPPEPLQPRWLPGRRPGRALRRGPVACWLPPGLARRGCGHLRARPGKAGARRAAWGVRADPRRGHQRAQGGRGWADAGGWDGVKSGFIFPIPDQVVSGVRSLSQCPSMCVYRATCIIFSTKCQSTVVQSISSSSIAGPGVPSDQRTCPQTKLWTSSAVASSSTRGTSPLTPIIQCVTRRVASVMVCSIVLRIHHRRSWHVL